MTDKYTKMTMILPTKINWQPSTATIKRPQWECKTFRLNIAFCQQNTPHMCNDTMPHIISKEQHMEDPLS